MQKGPPLYSFLQNVKKTLHVTTVWEEITESKNNNEIYNLRPEGGLAGPRSMRSSGGRAPRNRPAAAQDWSSFRTGHLQKLSHCSKAKLFSMKFSFLSRNMHSDNCGMTIPKLLPYQNYYHLG